MRYNPFQPSFFVLHRTQQGSLLACFDDAMRADVLRFLGMLLLLTGHAGAAGTSGGHSSSTHEARVAALTALSEDFPVHIFYYAWFGAPGIYDGSATSHREWDHDVLAHWDERQQGHHSSGKLHEPPEDIASVFYPSRGLYSSLDRKVVNEQMIEIAHARVDVVVFSWWRNGTHADVQGRKGPFPGTDGAVLPVLDGAAAAGIKVCFHLEPYSGRTIVNVRDDGKCRVRSRACHPRGCLLPCPASC